MLKENLVLIGNGMAGVRTLEELLKLAPDHYNITVFGEEPYGNYNRIMLSPVLASEKTIEQIMLNDDAWYAANGITLHKGKKVEEINRARREVIATDGTVAHYDRLIIATGSVPFMLPLPGADKEGVIGFRDIKDVDTMLEVARKHQHAVVIGGGLLGLEAANGLMKQGMDVTVVHLLDTLMERQLDKPAAQMLQKSLEARGMTFLMEHSTAEIIGNQRVIGVRFKNGTEIPADLVVMAVGIKPNIELGKAAGLHCERGIVVNDTLQTITDPKIYAIGECVQHRGIAYGLVAPLFEQAKVAANHLAQHGIARYEGTVTSTKLKVTGIELFSAGDFIGNDKTEEIVFKDAASGTYKKIVLQDNQIKGAVLYGDTVDGSWYFQLMKDGTDISAFRDTLLFGQAHLGDSGHNPDTRVASLPDSAEICGCNGVCKGDIVKAITEKKLFTLDEVRAHTKASASCGSCTGLVESLLAHTVGGDYSATPKTKPLCKCTDYTHDDIRHGIIQYSLKTMPAVREHFEWKTPDGCPACRNALNYYLLCAFPTEYVDDAQSRYINERAHGNIQKDGTYSVVPRLFGGMCTADQLRAIADVADKYQVPTMKVTGGQRIDMFGIQKEQLPAMWKDLTDAGFVSGHAYGKAMRTVKTCVGSEWCRFGTQDSTGLGVKLEELTWGSWMPHKFKLAVSGCPRNCAEATIKDFGVVCVDSGYELHIGGNGGIKVRVTDLLTKVETEEQVLEYCGAFCQFYREDAHYLERTAPWVERVGLDKIKKALEDAAGRKALYERFLISQQPAQIDPWKARAEGAEALEFTPITVDA
ncbi:MAG TPA: nitrite reductase large subunit NirB [Candidatus Thiothrix moscowensis]|uniref:nitrite reductase large subunit NirB n=1 Tax=unclassified Thiothrix TaxID=2636184 RepID=UPI0025E6C212|nr:MULTISPECIES: nitrite reductase large subunit NirB [unclassified Thiothrix]HRJ53922.1 nitrite reductase large subunit NirB [Candidatus Thiothrix moscowensis]HRJ94004.1 nitrite reductase large subunit NirB [Candidatus Thiothrix moscowensis]